MVKSDQKVGSLFDQKNDHFRVPKWVPEVMKIEIAGLRHFLPGSLVLLKFIFRFSAPLWNPLGASWEPSVPLEALLGSLWTQKHVKTQCFLMVLKRLFLGL